jgi:hypothetical protein
MSLVLAADGKSGSRLHGCPASNAVQKPSQRPRGAKTAGTPDKNEESSLEGVLGIGSVGQERSAHVQHHGPVARQDRLECGLVVLVKEAPE